MAPRLATLGIATLVVGTPFLDYVIASVRNSGIDLLLASLYSTATIVLIWFASDVPLSDNTFHLLEPTLNSQKAA